MRIRKSERVDTVQKLNDEIFPGEPLDHNVLDEHWIAWDGDTPIGFATIRPLVYDNDTAYLSRAGVTERGTGKGLHRRLIKIRLQWAKRNGYTRVITYTSRDNCKSYYNLQKCGFYLYEPGYRYVGKDFLYWRYDVEPSP